MEIKLPTARKQPAHLIKKEKPLKVIKEVEKNEVKKIDKNFKNFTLLLTLKEYEIIKKVSENEGRLVQPFLIRFLRKEGLFSEGDIFLGNKLSSNKIKSVSLPLTQEEHNVIEKIKEEEGRSKNQVVSMFLHQRLFQKHF